MAARRNTVENFNGFVMAHPPSTTAKKSSAVQPPGKKPVAPSRAKGTVNAAVKKILAPTSKTTTEGVSSTTKKKVQFSVRPSAKVEVLRRQNVSGKNLPVQIKRDDAKPERTEIKTSQEDDKITDTMENCKKLDDRVSDQSDNQEYEDDFEDYESDFESDTSIVSSPQLPPPEPPIAVKQPAMDDATGVKFALPVYVEEKLEPFLDERFEVNPLERTVEMGLANFKTAGKRKREQEAVYKMQSRGNILMGMIKLDTVSYSLLELPAIPYEQYIKMYGRSNMAQVQTQTHDDIAEKEVQTNEIDVTEKWTQRPIALTNGLDCSSSEYLKAKLGVGGSGSDDADRHKPRTATTAVDPERIFAVARAVLSMLDQQAMNRAKHLLTNDKSLLEFSGGFLSIAVSSLKLIAKRPVTSIEFVRITSSNTESLVSIHEVMDSHHQYIICIWSVSNTENPEYALKCPGRVTSFCAVIKTSCAGFIATAHGDGSVCLWDLRESRLHHQQTGGLPCPLRSPSFNTALSDDHGHRSKIVGLSSVTYNNAGAAEEESPDELCSLDEDFALTVWTVVDSWTDATKISERKNAGTAPWSSVRLVRMQIVQANKYVPGYLSQGVTATCMRLNGDQDAIIGTNSGVVFRCNLGEHRVWPSYYVSEDAGVHFTVNSLDICPFNSSYFLAACSNGEVMVFRTSRRQALKRLFVSQPNSLRAPEPVIQARWCTGYPGIVFGLDSNSSLHLWDVFNDVTAPMMSSTMLSGKKITSMSLTLTRNSQNTYAGLAFADGSVEIHQVKLKERKMITDNDYCDDHARFLADL